MTSLGLEVIRFDAQVCSVTVRPDTGAALRQECAELLSGPRPWAWLAERDGNPVGMLIAEPPSAAAWIAPLAGAAPAAYLLLAGVQVNLLHYAQVNPLPAPFWSQQGYRPLWTVWEARPASTVR